MQGCQLFTLKNFSQSALHYGESLRQLELRGVFLSCMLRVFHLGFRGVSSVVSGILKERENRKRRGREAGSSLNTLPTELQHFSFSCPLVSPAFGPLGFPCLLEHSLSPYGGNHQGPLPLNCWHGEGSSQSCFVTPTD